MYACALEQHNNYAAVNFFRRPDFFLFVKTYATQKLYCCSWFSAALFLKEKKACESVF